jgi:hypothetical protein
VGALLLWCPTGVVALGVGCCHGGVAREDRKAKRQLARTLRQLRDAKNAEAAETYADAVRQALAEVRLIIVAPERVDLYDRIRRDQSGDEAISVITDRRSTDRRLQLECIFPTAGVVNGVATTLPPCSSRKAGHR